MVLPRLAYRKVLSMRPRPLLCHLHDPELMPVGMALRLRGFRVIYDVHENWPEQAERRAPVPGLLRPLVGPAYRGVEGVLLSGIATVHVLESIERRYRRPRIVVRNLPELGLAIPRKPRRRDGRTRMVYVGGVGRTRGAVRMIRLAEELLRRQLDVELRIIGPVEDEGLVRQMRRTIDEAHLGERVSFNNQRLPPPEASAEIAAADIGLCILDPLRNYLNSLPIKVFEYMRFGLPVVASDFECWRPYVAGTRCGILVAPEDLQQIADGVQRMIEHPEEMAEMGRRGREAIRTQYCWEKEQHKLVDFYWRLLGKGSARRAQAAVMPAQANADITDGSVVCADAPAGREIPSTTPSGQPARTAAR
jgi:glycosyltransferase involved in cell wall biosynthesis